MANKSDDYNNKYMKIKRSSDNKLLLNEIIEIHKFFFLMANIDV